MCSVEKPEDIEFHKVLTIEEERETILIPGGGFIMGNSWDTVYNDNQNDELFKVTYYDFTDKEWIDTLIYDDWVLVDSFYIAKYSVTNRFFYEFVIDSGYSNQEYWSEEGWNWKDSLNIQQPVYWNDSLEIPYHSCLFSNQDETPVVGVSWYEAEAFCRWYGIRINKTVRLPYEAEWEKAARWDGNFDETSVGNRYPWGNEFDRMKLNGDAWEDGFIYCSPVHAFENGISSYGVYQMLGNVWEWCQDWYEKEYYSFKVFMINQKPTWENPRGPEKMPEYGYKVIRGGCFGPANSKQYRCSNRHGFKLDERGMAQKLLTNKNIGFRFVIETGGSL